MTKYSRQVIGSFRSVADLESALRAAGCTDTQIADAVKSYQASVVVQVADWRHWLFNVILAPIVLPIGFLILALRWVVRQVRDHA